MYPHHTGAIPGRVPDPPSSRGTPVTGTLAPRWPARVPGPPRPPRAYTIAADVISGWSFQYWTRRGRYSGNGGQATPVPARSARAWRTS